MNAPAAKDVLHSDATLDEIPVIDLEAYLSGRPGALDEVAEEIRHACQHIGFFFIVNHRLHQEQVDAAFAAMAALFDLPEAAKRRVTMNSHQSGWQPMGVDHGSWDVTDAPKPALTQAFKYTGELSPSDPDHLGETRFRGHNQWPAELSDDHRKDLVEYYSAIEGLGRKLLAPMAVSLNLAPDYFDGSFTRSDSVARCAHYPVTPDTDGQLGLIGHRDLGFLTLIPPATGPGLQILTASGRWIDQPQIDGAVLVNTGETLCAWTNDRYIATPHRVLASTTQDRYSAIFFLYPDLEAVVEPAPTTVGSDRPARYPTRTFAEIQAEFVRKHLAYTEDESASNTA